MSPEQVLNIIEKHRGTRGDVIAILEDIQASFNYLPKDALELVAKETGHSLVDLYGVATFYTAFSLEPRGDHLACVCMGTACHVRGAPRVLKAFEDDLGVKTGNTTDDRSFTLARVNCVGACALGPVAVIDGQYNSSVTVAQVPRMIQAYRDNEPYGDPEDDDEVIALRVLCPQCNRSLLTPDHQLGGYPMIHVTASFADKHGWIRLSSVLGDHRVQSEHELPSNALIDFFCPKCHTQLRSTHLCPACDAPTIPLLVHGGGIVKICSRRGCDEHLLELG